MRTLLALVALLVVTGAANKYDGDWVDPTDNIPPLSSVSSWSYYPNPFQCNSTASCECGTAPSEPACSPENWAYSNNGSFKTCLPSTGGQQTPINLDAFEDSYEFLDNAEGSVKFSAGKCTGLVNSRNGTYEVSFIECSKPFTVTVNGETWDLWQMHIHGPSEHTVNGIYFSAEVHLVHVPKGVAPSAAVNALVLGVFLSPGKANGLFRVLASQNASAGNVPLAKAVNPYSLIPQDKAYWHYTGSLTTPGYGGCQLNSASPDFDPAQNNINWLVFKTPRTASISQFAWLTDYLCGLPLPYLCQNKRPLQEILSTTDIYTYGKALK